MESESIVQLIIIIAFIGIIITLFMEKKDYLSYAVIFVLIIGLSSTLLLDLTEEEMEGIILAVDWEVIVFLFCLFCIVEILNQNKIFHVIAIKIVNRFHASPRKMFWVMCLSSTLIATIIEDLSVAMIFVPILIRACRKMNLDASAYLFGVTICINLASTLTPFGSAENIIIANAFNLSLHWHLVYLGIYFIVTTLITLFFLDRFILKKSLKYYYMEMIYYSKRKFFDGNPNHNSDEIPKIIEKLSELNLKELQTFYQILIDEIERNPPEGITHEEFQKFTYKQIFHIKVDKKIYKKNIMGLIIFTGFLAFISDIIISGILGLIIFVFLNPVEYEEGKTRASLSYYLRQIDAKLIYFFIMLFITVYFMELAGLTRIIEQLVGRWTGFDPFLIAVEILLITSLLSGFLDDAPITILFIPIIADIVALNNLSGNLLFIAFTLGINLGGNFLPQGAACDMMTLELARKNKVKNFTYKRLTIVGGSYALLHIILGIIYMWFFKTLFM